MLMLGSVSLEITRLGECKERLLRRASHQYQLWMRTHAASTLRFDRSSGDAVRIASGV